MSETITLSSGSGASAASFTFPIGAVPPQAGIDYDIEIIIRQQFNHLKARMMNLAECSCVDTRQCNALKGLMKDALNQAYYGALDKVNTELKSRGISDPSVERGPMPSLDAKGLSDIFVD